MNRAVQSILVLDKDKELRSCNIVGQMLIDNVCYRIVGSKDWIKDKQDAILNKISRKIHSTVVGKFEVDEKFYLILKHENSSSHEDSIQILTERERQIAALTAHGLSNKEIGKQLHISEWTVSAHLRRIFSKLKVGSRSEMVYRCAPFLE